MVYTTRRSSHWDWLVMNSWPSVDSMTSVSFARAVSLPRCPTCPVRRIAIVTTDGVSAKKPDWAGRRLFSILLFFPSHSTTIFLLLGLFCLFVCLPWPDIFWGTVKKNKIKKETHWATKGKKKSLILRLYLSLSVCVSLSVRELVIDRSPPRAHPSKLGTLH
jgi:hypothetical protein